MLTLSNIDKSFNIGTSSETTLFKDLNLTIKQGEFITVIGSNGAGKSTLLNVIGGSISPEAGTISLDDKGITRLKEYERSRFIGRVFQDPSKGTSPSMSVIENLSLAMNKGRRFGLSWGMSKSNIGCIKDNLAKLEMGLEDKLTTKVGLLSGGQRQALSLLMATMVEPKLLLLDEHTAALDPNISAIIMELTRQMLDEKKITTLMITHNLNHAVAYGTRLLMLHQGRIIIDIDGEEKKNLTVNKLMAYFDRYQIKESLSDELLLAK